MPTKEFGLTRTKLTPRSTSNFFIQKSQDSFFKPNPTGVLHQNGPPTIQKQAGGSTPSTPCVSSVSIGGLAQFNRSNLRGAQKDDWGTYLGVTSQMNLGPEPDHSGHCMKETLTTVSNTCPSQVYSRDGSTTSPCIGNKCLDINRYGSAGDSATRSTLSDGQTSFH